jgi:hypothetical protein
MAAFCWRVMTPFLFSFPMSYILLLRLIDSLT